jgi:hypothetical protein
MIHGKPRSISPRWAYYSKGAEQCSVIARIGKTRPRWRRPGRGKEEWLHVGRLILFRTDRRLNGEWQQLIFVWPPAPSGWAVPARQFWVLRDIIANKV